MRDKRFPDPQLPCQWEKRGQPMDSYGILLSQVSDDLGFAFAVAHLPVLYFLVAGICLDKCLCVWETVSQKNCFIFGSHSVLASENKMAILSIKDFCPSPHFSKSSWINLYKVVLMLRHLLLIVQNCGNSLVSPVLLDIVKIWGALTACWHWSRRK